MPNILETNEGACGTPMGVWCIDNPNCENMSIEDAQNNSICLSGNIFDESIKNCLIFTFLDAINYELGLLSSGVGLGTEFYKFDGKGVKTATEVISENSDTG